MSQYENPWTYDDKIFDSDLICDYYGFVYLITGKQTGKKIHRKKIFLAKKKTKNRVEEKSYVRK